MWRDEGLVDLALHSLAEDELHQYSRPLDATWGALWLRHTIMVPEGHTALQVLL